MTRFVDGSGEHAGVVHEHEVVVHEHEAYEDPYEDVLVVDDDKLGVGPAITDPEFQLTVQETIQVDQTGAFDVLSTSRRFFGLRLANSNSVWSIGNGVASNTIDRALVFAYDNVVKASIREDAVVHDGQRTLTHWVVATFSPDSNHLGRLTNYTGAAGIIDGDGNVSTDWKTGSTSHAMGQVELTTTSVNLAGVVVAYSDDTEDIVVPRGAHYPHLPEERAHGEGGIRGGTPWWTCA